ncbi:hypothetical protein HYV81_01235 [Candidatus Woesearchaeota archaeon]|nr:hypothetical protein [Candidatus Woesearchaeota archaeon]
MVTQYNGVEYPLHRPSRRVVEPTPAPYSDKGLILGERVLAINRAAKAMLEEGLDTNVVQERLMGMRLSLEGEAAQHKMKFPYRWDDQLLRYRPTKSMMLRRH